MTLRINLLTVVFVAGLIALAAALGRSPTSKLPSPGPGARNTDGHRNGHRWPGQRRPPPRYRRRPPQRRHWRPHGSARQAYGDCCPTATATPDPNAPKASLLVKLISGVTTAQRETSSSATAAPSSPTWPRCASQRSRCSPRTSTSLRLLRRRPPRAARRDRPEARRRRHPLRPRVRQPVGASAHRLGPPLRRGRSGG